MLQHVAVIVTVAVALVSCRTIQDFVRSRRPLHPNSETAWVVRLGRPQCAALGSPKKRATHSGLSTPQSGSPGDCPRAQAAAVSCRAVAAQKAPVRGSYLWTPCPSRSALPGAYTWRLNEGLAIAAAHMPALICLTSASCFAQLAMSLPHRASAVAFAYHERNPPVLLVKHVVCQIKASLNARRRRLVGEAPRAVPCM